MSKERQDGDVQLMNHFLIKESVRIKNAQSFIVDRGKFALQVISLKDLHGACGACGKSGVNDEL